MNKIDLMLMAFRNLWRRKSRTILTILSVVIGTFSIIIMISLGIGMKKSQDDMIKSIGSIQNIMISSDSGQQKPKKIDKNEIARIKRNKHVKEVIPYVMLPSELKIKNHDNYFAYTSIKVIPDKILDELTQDDIESGKLLRKNDDNKMLYGKAVEIRNDDNYELVERTPDLKFQIMLGYDEGFNPLDDSKPQSKKIDIDIAGILKDESMLSKDSVYLNEKTYKNLLREDQKLENPTLTMGNTNKNPSKNIEYYYADVVVDDLENVESVEGDLRGYGYDTQSLKSIADQFNESTKTVQFILAGIGSVAFIVSAIGIINTMLMSIYERRKEIGVMKVIGASIKDIRNLFLCEAGFIGFIGGIFGLILSTVVSHIINNIYSSQMVADMGNIDEVSISYIPPWLYIIAAIFAFIIGVIAGYVPARRATRLKAIDSLRSDWFVDLCKKGIFIEGGFIWKLKT